MGKDTMNKLLSHFKSVNKIKNSSEEEIAKVVGASKAQLIKKYYSTP
ncbi:MAG TPA: helix-hairpin-helix domain-containing protein [Bacteroidia bacterium]|nr:helix-hairpin-helix domain-containing protein [Bacteroidia bacterium]